MNIRTEVLLLFAREEELKEKVDAYNEDRKNLLYQIMNISYEKCESNVHLNT